jgi:hypothetical protein
MHAHRRAVDHLHRAVTGLDDGVHQAVPDAGLAPAVEAVVGRGAGAVSLGQIAPWRSRAQHPEDAIENATVPLRPHATPALRQKRFDDTPLGVAQVVAHDPSPDVW